MHTVEFQGVTYNVPDVEPPQNRDPRSLHALFREPLKLYVAFANLFTPHDLRIGECRRTLERQCYLYSDGRINENRIRSWTIFSKHREGLAADLILIDEFGKPVWDPGVWRQLYADAPPQWYGLTPISKEWNHLEHASAAQIIDRRAELGVTQT